MSMRYREAVEIAKTYSFFEIFQPVGFQLVGERKSPDGSEFANLWENVDLGQKTQIITGSEEDDSFMISLTHVEGMRMNKLELIKHLHAGGDAL